MITRVTTRGWKMLDKAQDLYYLFFSIFRSGLRIL